MIHTQTEKPKPKIEIVGIYPEKRRPNAVATFHVYLVDKDIDIRGGVIYRLPSGKYFIQMPQGSGSDEVTGKRICFPTISFTDAEYEREVRREVIRQVLKELETMTFD
ncbi:hypothetical protein LCGC14_0456970 [marine sediment metagenome]|uniref:SpoVG family protein n=1 Tax=marine sediment metagenome TaxID=412755 RepID=A0A0F9SGB6_9ZZZZ|nr:hypothetical protein [Candidatus Aminicenantes bacterium]